MRNLLTLLILVCLTQITLGQTIFRATPIDQEQNERLDNLEAKFSSLENSIENLTRTVEKQVVAKELELTYKTPPNSKSCACSDACTCGCESGKCPCSCSTPTPEGSISYAQPQPIQSVSYGSSGFTGYYSSGSASNALRSQIQANRTGRIYAHVSPSYAKTHLIEHGYSPQTVASLSTQEAIELHNLTHGGILTPGSQHQGYSAAPLKTGRPVNNYSSSCANGQCPTSSSTSRGFFGFRR